jgi:hypothetical protein
MITPPNARSLCLQLLDGERLVCLETLPEFQGAEVFQESAMDKGVVPPTRGAESKVASAQLLDERPAGVIASQVWHALQSVDEGFQPGSLPCRRSVRSLTRDADGEPW